jgi:mRNA-degrading endonuclease RelE of RelBE toxin-antitoxin system
MPLKRAIEVVLSPEAMEHLAGYTVYKRRIVLDAIERQLAFDPTLPTRNLKSLHPNPFASWELRVWNFRVYYQVETERDIVSVYIVAVGRKIRNWIIIGGKEIYL